MQDSTPHTQVAVLGGLVSTMVNHDETVSGRLSFTTGVSKAHLCSLQNISARLFQLTEWVYNFIISAPSSSAASSSGMMQTFYEQCLDWYREIFSYSEKDYGRTPFILFAQ